MSFRAWGPKTNLVYALSVGATQADAVNPIGFSQGGSQFSIYNSGSTDVFVQFYVGATPPTLTFPVTGSPPVGQGPGVVVPKGARIQVSARADATSFSAIGQAAGPSIIYVQRGDGSA